MSGKPQLRSGQVVSTNGPGAMVDLPDSSVIVAGLDHWRHDAKDIPLIHEPRLVAKAARLLGVPALTLRSPPPASDRDFGFSPGIIAWRFPEWFIVQRSPVGTLPGFRRRRLVHLNSLEKDKYKDVDGKRYAVVPVRFVRACERGHLGDIDWKAFVHGMDSSCPRDLWFEERGTSGDLDQIWVICDCGQERVMSQAARMKLRALGSCNGARPWLGRGTKESCGRPNRLLIRSASNAYFPQLLSVISIPDTRSPLDDVVRALWEDFLSDVDSAEALTGVRKKPTVAARLQGIPDDAVLASIGRVRVGSDGTERPVKDVEFEALSESRDELGADVPEGDFFARSLPRAVWDAPWMAAVQRVVLVHRLREVTAQVGFTRFEAAGPDIQGDLSLDVERAPLALDLSWLPAIENRGEGVFLQFCPDAIAGWMERDVVQQRGRRLMAGFTQWKTEHEGSSREFPGLPYYLLHSISHMLLSSISVECGYPASSLRERVYAFDGHFGILIYTGSSDAEGTLGGLVETAREIKRHMMRALDAALLCSNDPVCAYHAPSEFDQQPLHGSACHGCLLMSETSCEQRNDFLDRALVVPTIENLGAELIQGAL